jgi:hypothetical protein
MATREPRSTATSTSVKISSEPYDFDRPDAVSGVLPQDTGFGKRTFATRSEVRTSSRPLSSRSARRAMFCAATVLVALARILSACAISAPAFFSALARSRRRRRSSVSRCSRYVFQPTL